MELNDLTDYKAVDEKVVSKDGEIEPGIYTLEVDNMIELAETSKNYVDSNRVIKIQRDDEEYIFNFTGDNLYKNIELKEGDTITMYALEGTTYTSGFNLPESLKKDKMENYTNGDAGFFVVGDTISKEQVDDISQHTIYDAWLVKKRGFMIREFVSTNEKEDIAKEVEDGDILFLSNHSLVNAALDNTLSKNGDSN